MERPTEDATPHAAGLEQLHRRRARLSDRVRPPWWYLAAFAVVAALLCATPFATYYLGWNISWSSIVALPLFFPLQAALARVSGVDIGTRTLRYPSGRPTGIGLIVVVLAALVGEHLLLEDGRTGIALPAGILAVVCWQAHLSGIRRDLRDGTA